MSVATLDFCVPHQSTLKLHSFAIAAERINPIVEEWSEADNIAVSKIFETVIIIIKFV